MFEITGIYDGKLKGFYLKQQRTMELVLENTMRNSGRPTIYLSKKDTIEFIKKMAELWPDLGEQVKITEMEE